MKNADILKLAEEERAIKEEHVKNENWSKVSASGILWGGTREDGKLYHAYCEFELKEGFSHPLKNDGFFEDCIQTSKEENAREARKKGWVIGRGEQKDLAICPLCVKKLKSKKD